MYSPQDHLDFERLDQTYEFVKGLEGLEEIDGVIKEMFRFNALTNPEEYITDLVKLLIKANPELKLTFLQVYDPADIDRYDYD